MKHEWKDYVEQVNQQGFEQASPLARLIWSCEVGQIDQHASRDLIFIMERFEELAALRADLAEAQAERDRLKAISDAALKWRSEWPDEEDVIEATEEQCPCAICQLILACDALRGEA